jgi:hypothetical protein
LTLFVHQMLLCISPTDFQVEKEAILGKIRESHRLLLAAGDALGQTHQSHHAQHSQPSQPNQPQHPAVESAGMAPAADESAAVITVPPAQCLACLRSRQQMEVELDALYDQYFAELAAYDPSLMQVRLSARFQRNQPETTLHYNQSVSTHSARTLIFVPLIRLLGRCLFVHVRMATNPSPSTVPC